MPGKQIVSAASPADGSTATPGTARRTTARRLSGRGVTEVAATAAFAAVTGSSNALIVDVRTNAEWCLVGVPRLQSVLFLEWADVDGAPNPTFLEELNHWVRPDTTLYFMSRSGGNRSKRAALAALSAGFERAHSIINGFEGPLDEAGRRGHRGWKVDALPWRQW
jgi:rhodanese-related sulfurtransferase